VKLFNGIVAMLCTPPSGANMCMRLRAIVMMVNGARIFFAGGFPWYWFSFSLGSSRLSKAWGLRFMNW